MQQEMIPSGIPKKLSVDDFFVDEMKNQLSLAHKKKLSVITHIPTRFARLGSLMADATWKEKLSAMYEILGGDPKGMAIAFNVQLKKLFGFSATNDMTESQANALTNARLTAARVCADGLDHGLEKHVIIEKIWIVVKQIADSHKQLESLLK